MKKQLRLLCVLCASVVLISGCSRISYKKTPDSAEVIITSLGTQRSFDELKLERGADGEIKAFSIAGAKSDQATFAGEVVRSAIEAAKK